MFWLRQDGLLAADMQASQPVWSDSMVRDTIASIVSAEGYRRSLAESAMSKLWRWVSEHFWSLFRKLDDMPYGREITLAVLLLVVGLIVARIVLGVQREERSRRVATRVHVGARGLTIAEAERVAALGNFTEAAHVLYASLLQAGAARGEFRVHPSKTTGDYAREIRKKRGAWFSPFQSFRSRYDRVIYGDMNCSASDFDALLSDARNMLQQHLAA